MSAPMLGNVKRVMEKMKMTIIQEIPDSGLLKPVI
jgi:hypothetical protein